MCIAANFKYRCVNALALRGRWIDVDVEGREGKRVLNLVFKILTKVKVESCVRKQKLQCKEENNTN